MLNWQKGLFLLIGVALCSAAQATTYTVVGAAPGNNKNIVHDAVVARFARTLATTFNAGVPLVEALESTAGAAGNSVYAKAIRQIKDDVTTGTTLYNAIKSTGMFPNLLLQMVNGCDTK